jgi:hypothetical protein
MKRTGLGTKSKTENNNLKIITYMATTKKTAVKKTATKKVTKKAATKKVTAKKTATKKAATKKVTKKATAKKPATKKAATKKAVTKKVTTKKATTKKAATKKAATKKAATKKAATKKATTKKAVKPAVRKERLPRGYKITKIVKELNLPEGIGGKDHYEVYEVTSPSMPTARYFISDEAAREYIGKSEKAKLEAKALSGKGHAPVGMREVAKVTSDLAAAAELEAAGAGPKSDRKEAKVMYSDSE